MDHGSWIMMCSMLFHTHTHKHTRHHTISQSVSQLVSPHQSIQWIGVVFKFMHNFRLMNAEMWNTFNNVVRCAPESNLYRRRRTLMWRYWYESSCKQDWRPFFFLGDFDTAHRNAEIAKYAPRAFGYEWEEWERNTFEKLFVYFLRRHIRVLSTITTYELRNALAFLALL